MARKSLFRAMLAIGVLTIPLLVGALATPAAAADMVTLAVMGETHGTRTITKQLVGQAAAKGATGCVCPGDFIYGDAGATPQGWRDMMRPLMGTMLPAQGNHDHPWSDWQSIFPNGAPYYAKTIDGATVITLNSEQSLGAGSTQRAWLERTLASQPADALKIVSIHRPWWLPTGAHHDMAEFEAKNRAKPGEMDALMVKHGVDLVVSAHEKNYQHSLRDGVHYLVAGGAGPEWDKYTLSYHLPGAIKRLSTPVASVLRMSGTSMTLESFDQNGARIEAFTMSGSSAGGTPAPSTGTFAPTFTPHEGNEWWIQAKLSEKAASVDARVDGGAWKPLALKSWGAWAASYHAPAGSIVEFRAISSGGDQALSPRFHWPDGSPAGGSAPSAGTFRATFSPGGGNEWWIQTRVEAPKPLGGVETRVDGGAWKPLALKSWGAWAASYHAPPGSRVEFRATATDGAQATSGAYAWPSGTPVAGGTFSATFTPHDGNEWWVQTKLSAPERVASVEARVDGGAWKPLALKSWSSWAASFHAPAGSKVEFRATSAAGATATSAAYVWPV